MKNTSNLNSCTIEEDMIDIMAAVDYELNGPSYEDETSYDNEDAHGNPR